MSDRAIEAMMTAVYEAGKPWTIQDGDLQTSDATWEHLLRVAWAAGVEALIAHEPCSGTNVVETDMPVNGPTPFPCPGPHTVIDKGDGTKLYAASNKVHAYYEVVELEFTDVFPSGWRIE